MTDIDTAPVLFSVVTIVLNDRKGFVRTAESILSQDKSLFEWVVTDGDSTDGTVDEIRHREGAITNWVSERDNGIYDALNRSIRRCRGRFVIFMHAGDEFADTTVLTDVSAALEKARATGTVPTLIAGAALIVFESGLEVRRQAKELDKHIWHRMPAYHQAMFFDRQMVTAHPFDLSYRTNGDYAHMCKLYSVGLTPLYMDRVICRFAAGGASSQRWKELLWEAIRAQRNLLRQSFPLIALSFARRAAWLCAMNLGRLLPTRRRSLSER